MDQEYPRKLIKGKITEVIFEEMFRSVGEFDIIPIGYEHTTPILAQYQHHFEIRQVLDNIRTAPDFALISHDKSQVFIVEVKYARELLPERTLEIAQKTIDHYNPCFLFIATQKAFYFSSCRAIIGMHGEIEELGESWVNKDTQTNYLSLLREFID